MQLRARPGPEDADDAKLGPGLQHGHCCRHNMGHVAKKSRLAVLSPRLQHDQCCRRNMGLVSEG